MDPENQKFLEAEQSAENLVNTLRQLHAEGVSYQTATRELDAVRTQLVTLIEKMQLIANGSLEAVKTLRDIGGPEILRRITQLEEKIERAQQMATKQVSQIEGKIAQESATHSKRLERLTILMILTLVCAAGALIIGAVTLSQ
jgi:gas vesicle protein